MIISDQWETPQSLFDELDSIYHFDIDLCANDINKKCERYCTDYLNDFSVKGKTCFMNPPYSNPYPFIEKAWNDALFNNIVCLVKCDTSTRWWAIFWDYEKGEKPGCKVKFFPRRLKFYNPYKKGTSPTFSSALLIFDRRM